MNPVYKKEYHSDISAHTKSVRHGSLKTRLFVWFFLVALVPLTVVSVISYYTAKESLREAAFHSVINSVEQKSAFINTWFNYRLIDLHSQATSVSNTKLLQKLRQAFKSSGKSPKDFTKSYQWQVISNERGEDLKTFCKLYGYYDVFLIDAEGNILFSDAQESDLGTNLIDGPQANTRFAASFQEALKSGRPVFSDLEYYAPSNGIMAGFLSEVMLDEDGEKIGALAIQVTPHQIEHIMRAGHESDSHIKAYVVGYAYESVGVTLRSKLDAHMPVGGESHKQDAMIEDTRKLLSRRVDTKQSRLWYAEHGPEGIEAESQTEVVFVYDGPDGSRVLGTHKDIFIAGVDWGLFAEIPEQDAFASSTQLKKLMIVLVVVTAALVVVIVFVITGRIVRPIVRLSSVARRIADGDLKQRIHTCASDEIGELAISFNRMVSNLGKSFGDLSTLRFALDEHAIVSITDIRGDIIFVNDKFCKLSGYSRKEMLGHNHRLVKSEEHSVDFYRKLWKTIASGDVWTGEIKNRAKDGSYYWVDATIVPFKGVDGKIEQYVAIRTDITQVKEAEQQAMCVAKEFEFINLELEGQREETEAMNSELLQVNNDLEIARAEASLATKAKSEFLANMSHEIRTPLTAILGFSENLRDGDLTDAEMHDAIETIHSNGKYLLSIINDILDMSKIEAGKMEVERIPLSPQKTIADVVTLMKVRSDAKNIAFCAEYIGLIPETIQSDPTRLKQILINIIGNAIKFTDEGGVRLVTRFVKGEASDSDDCSADPYLQFDIIDTGVGLTEKQLGNMFQAFSQADNTMSRRFGGTGLGLTISKKFAEKLGGDIIIVDSQPGRGTRFRVTVEVGSLEDVKMIDPQISAQFASRDTTPKRSQTARLVDCRILLAEDGQDNQRLISFVLKKAGADVTIADNGQIAFDKAMAATQLGNPFDIILMDMQMPVLDGYKATTALRGEDYTGPIIALTAHAMASDREKCIDSGCDDFATKPIDREKLIELIQDYLERARVTSYVN